MASLAVAGLVAGDYLTAGSAVAIISAAAAAYIDQAYVTPALFPPDDTEGPRLDSFGFMSASEHSPLFRVFGEEAVRVPGTLIWSGTLQEVKDKQDAGKGGGGGSATTYKYFTDVAWSWCLGPIAEVSQIRVDGRIFYGENEGQNVTSDQIAITKQEILDEDGAVIETWMVLTSSEANFKKFKSGLDTVITGASNGGNNGTFQCISAKLVKSTGVSTLKVINSAVVAESSGATINAVQGFPKSQINKAAVITNHLGYNDASGPNAQDPSSLIEAEEGENLVPAFRNIAYTEVDRMALRPYGNRIPQTHGILQPNASQTVGEAIESALSLTEMVASQYDASLATDALRGWGIRGQVAMRTAIAPLLIAYDLVVQEANQTLTFFPRASATKVTIPAADLAAHPDGNDTERPVTLTMMDESGLPSEINVSYLDPLMNYQQASQRYRKQSFAADHAWDIRLPLTLGKNEALDIARRLLWTAWANRRQFRFLVGPKYIKLRPSDIVVITVFGQTFEVLLTRVEIGVNWIINCEGIAEEQQVLTFDNSAADDPTDPDPLGPYIPPVCRLYLLDIPPMREDDYETLGFYSAVAAVDSGAQWQGAAVFKAAISAGNFKQFYQVPEEATMGYVIESSAMNDVSNTAYMDRSSTINVELYDGELESITEEQLLNGGNRMVIGREIIGFQTAELIGVRQYTLSNLLRGLRDTSDHTVHADGEQVVFLNDLALQFINTTKNQLGNSKFLKPVPTGGDKDDYNQEVPLVAQGEPVRCFRVMDIRGARDGSNNLTISWIRRSREFAGFMEKPANFEASATVVNTADENTGWYEIDIYDGPDTNTDSVVRTIYVGNFESTFNPNVTSQSYTAAQQTTDGLTPGDAVTLIIYKTSAVGRGNGQEATI